MLEAKSQGFTLLKLPFESLKYENFTISPKEILEFFPDTDNTSKLPIAIRQSFRLHNIQTIISKPNTQQLSQNQLDKTEQKDFNDIIKNLQFK